MLSPLVNTLRRLRKHRKLTQDELGNAIGLPRGAVARWESGARPVPSQHLPALASVLGVARPEHLATLVSLDADLSTNSAQSTPVAVDASVCKPEGSLEHMLALTDLSHTLHHEARTLMGEGVYRHFLDAFPRDRATELLCAHHIAASGGQLVWTSPLALASEQLVVAREGAFVYTGHHVRPALIVRCSDEELVVFGQVSLGVVAQSRRYRPDFLCRYRVAGQAARWMHVELDGGFRAERIDADARRASGLGTPEIRFPNEVLWRSDFFEHRLMRQVRDAQVWMR
ncbi:MAG: helix-turn-helix domain-containing protein [Proteobacteria bacterium]|nr:helix-turn-helix domain-containing protein [Pseudomonadota bacterium]